MKYIDIHSHLYFNDFDHDRDQVIDRIIKNKIGSIIVGTNIRNSLEAINLAKKDEHFFATAGLHPTDIDGTDLNALKTEIGEIIKNPKVVAVGECGLDYFRMGQDIQTFKNRQKECFEIQVELAIENNLPLMIHCRDAYEEILDILKKFKKRTADPDDSYYQKRLIGNFHFFAGSIKILKQVLDLGFHVSYTGVITFASQYEELIKLTPMDRIHAETDAPFVAPIPFRGKRNEPTYVLEIIKKIAEIKDLTIREVSMQLLSNAEELFKIK